MKIGILNSDTVEIEGTDEFGQYPEMFFKVFGRVNTKVAFKTYEVQMNNFPDDLHECDAYLITGSKASAYEDIPWINNLKKFIQKLDRNKKKLVGICFGHQVIAEALGGKVRKSPTGWHVGIDSITFNDKAIGYGTKGDQLNLIFSHQDEVETLPAGAEIIAESKICPVGMFLVEDHIMCIQGHIELERKFSQILYKFRKDMIGIEKFNAACDSLAKKTNELQVVANIIKFVET